MPLAGDRPTSAVSASSVPRATPSPSSTTTLRQERKALVVTLVGISLSGSEAPLEIHAPVEQILAGLNQYPRSARHASWTAALPCSWARHSGVGCTEWRRSGCRRDCRCRGALEQRSPGTLTAASASARPFQAATNLHMRSTFVDGGAWNSVGTSRQLASKTRGDAPAGRGTSESMCQPCRTSDQGWHTCSSELRGRTPEATVVAPTDCRITLAEGRQQLGARRVPLS
jgi:hypothetical protein